jgi:hypothetical protein
VQGSLRCLRTVLCSTLRVGRLGDLFLSGFPTKHSTHTFYKPRYFFILDSYEIFGWTAQVAKPAHYAILSQPPLTSSLWDPKHPILKHLQSIITANKLSRCSLFALIVDKMHPAETQPYKTPGVCSSLIDCNTFHAHLSPLPFCVSKYPYFCIIKCTTKHSAPYDDRHSPK